MTLRLWLAIIVAGIVLGLAGGLWIVFGQLETARTQRDAAVAELRQEIVRTEREAILSVDPADDATMAPVLRQALDAADRIGGLK